MKSVQKTVTSFCPALFSERSHNKRGFSPGLNCEMYLKVTYLSLVPLIVTLLKCDIIIASHIAEPFMDLLYPSDQIIGSLGVGIFCVDNIVTINNRSFSLGKYKSDQISESMAINWRGNAQIAGQFKIRTV